MFKRSHTVLLITALFFSTFYNNLFWKKVSQVYPFNSENVWYFISLFIVLSSVIYLLLEIINFKYILKPVLILLFLITSAASYYMDSYGVVIDYKMINNIFETQSAEVYDLLNFKLFLNLFLLGIVPSYMIYKLKIEYLGFKREFFARVLIFIAILAVVIGNLLLFSRFYTSFFREHKPLRYYVNPTYYIYSFGKYVGLKYFKKSYQFKHIGLDAKLIKKEKRPKLLFLVVGESVRWDHLSLNGYDKETNPLLKKESVISFDKMYSCGTETATSVPCMFSFLSRSNFNVRKGLSYDNLLDIAKRAGINVLWIDNNSNSKGVALRVAYKSIRGECNGECKDEVMLKDLPKFLEETDKDTIVVLHQMGNHGPAYYKRYPKEFEKFKPVCKSNQLQECTKEEIINAYDNTLLYTDYFLSKTIELLKKESKKFQTALLYVSDHGESLGEGGIYLHAMPYPLAPVYQKRVGAFVWFGSGFEDIDKNCLKKIASKEFSQDYYFSTVLSLMGISTEVYNKNLDIFSQCKR